MTKQGKVKEKIKKKNASKKATPKIDTNNWNTTDEDEVKHRKIRAELEKFQVKNQEPSQPYFGSYHVFSNKSNKKYNVEIRSLDQLLNSCECPDYRSNALGTCKHVEAVLINLRKGGIRKFDQAKETGSDRAEIFLNTMGNGPTICVRWPKKVSAATKGIIEPYFSSDDNLLSDPTIKFDDLNSFVLRNKKIKNQVRVSQHIQYYINYQKSHAQKQSAKECFLKDVELGKRTLDFVKFPLLPYQKEGILHLAFKERALLADEMGLGKTVQAVAASELLRQLRGVQRVLVVTTASLKAEWEEQIEKFTDLPNLVISGDRQNRLSQYRQNSFFYLMNYEQILSDYADIERLLAPDVIILDEAQRIKNWRTKTANAVKELKSRYAFVLTGTPIENRIDDVYSIIQFLDPHVFGPLFRFNRDFYELNEEGRPVGYKNLDELYRRLRDIMLCRKKHDVEDELPKRLNSNYFVGMEEEQLNRYQEYEQRVSQLLARAKTRPLYKEEFEKLQRWLACMRMLCDTPYILDKNCRISPKLTELENILDELLEEQTTKIIIFSEWERMLMLVKNIVEEKGLDIAWHTGSVPQHKRRECIKRFKQDQHCRLFLSTDAGSVGLNLQAANVVINLDLPWNPAKLEQRIARAWRKFQTRPVQVINLICENSIEHRMLYLLGEKQRLADGVLTGKDDLKSMALPSGRVAFMERMQALMGQDDVIDSDQETPVDVENIQEKLRDVLLGTIGDHLESLHCYNLPDQEKQLFLAVCDTEPEVLREKLKRHLDEGLADLELIDRHTFEAIQRLIDKGILNYKSYSAAVYDRKSPSVKFQMQKKIVDETKQLLLQAEHQYKMAKLLLGGEFIAESVSPLKESFNLILQAFTCLMEEKTGVSLEKISVSFIEDMLVKQYGLSEEAVFLFLQLENGVHDFQLIKKLHKHQQKIIGYVNETVDKVINQPIQITPYPPISNSFLPLISRYSNIAITDSLFPCDKKR